MNLTSLLCSGKPFTMMAASPDHKIQVIISEITMSDPSGKGIITKNSYQE